MLITAFWDNRQDPKKIAGDNKEIIY